MVSLLSLGNKKHCGFCFAISLAPKEVHCLVRSPVKDPHAEELGLSVNSQWGTEASFQQPHECIWKWTFQPSQTTRWNCSPADILTPTLWETLRHNHPVKLLPVSWPSETASDNRVCCFKPLHFVYSFSVWLLSPSGAIPMASGDVLLFWDRSSSQQMVQDDKPPFCLMPQCNGTLDL